MTREVRSCLAEMGVTDDVMAKVRSASNHTDGQKALNEAKEVCRRGFRRVAIKYHPDHNQHLPADELEEKAKRFKRMKSVHDDFLKSRYRGPRSSQTRKAASNFDPFGFHAAAEQDLEDDLRYWNDPMLRNFVKIKRERERRRDNVIEELRKRIYWDSLGLNYEDLERHKAKEKVVLLPDRNGVYYPERSKWVIKTERRKKPAK